MNDTEKVYQSVLLREEYLKTKMKMLGFEKSENLKNPLNPNTGYRVLGRVGSSLERYVNPVRAVLYKEKNNEQTLETLSEMIADEKSFMENQDELTERIRYIYPDFGLHMDQKVSEEDWKIYTKVMQETGKLVRDLTIGSKQRDLTKITKREEGDIISHLIDSREFAKACKIEDTFMTQEFEAFKKSAEEKGFFDEEVKDTTPCVILAELVREAESIANKKGRYIANYEKYNQFLEGLSDQIKIQPKEIYEKEEGIGREDE